MDKPKETFEEGWQKYTKEDKGTKNDRKFISCNKRQPGAIHMRIEWN